MIFLISFGSCKKGPPRGWLATLSWPASCVCTRMIESVWGKLDMSSIMCATRCSKMQQVRVAFSKSSSSTFLATVVTCHAQYNRKIDLYLHKEVKIGFQNTMSHRDSAKTARPTLQRCLQESPPWKYEHGLNTAEWLVSNISNGFYVLPQVDTITYTARHVPSQMKRSKSPVRDLKKVKNWFYPLRS